MASTWGTNTWGSNEWQDDEVTVVLSSPGTISALGTPQSFNVEGWGRQQWDNSGWGVEYSVEPSGQSITSEIGTATGDPVTIASLEGIGINVYSTFPTVDNTTPVSVTGFGITSSLGTANAENVAGWGRQAWGNSGWGVQYSIEPSGVSATFSIGTVTATPIETVELTGQSLTSSVGEIIPADVIGVSSAGVITSALGSLSSVGTLVGWGRNGWGEESWGSSINSVIELTGVSSSFNIGSVTVADQAIGLTGISSSFSVGSISPADVMGLTGQDISLSVGSLTAADVMGLTGQSITSSIGSITLDNQTMGLTGQSITSTLGSAEITTNPIVTPTGLSTTASVGSLTAADVVGLTGQSLTSLLGTVTTIPIYGPVDTGSNTSYSDVSTGSNNSYSDVSSGSNTSYSDVSTGSNSSYSDVATGSNTSYSDVA